MTKKNFAKYFILATLGLALFFQTLLWVMPEMSYMDDEYALYIQQRDFIRNDQHPYKIIFMGDSRMKAGALPDQISEEAYNFALGGANTYEMYYSLVYYLEKHPAPKTLVLGFSPVHYESHGEFSARTLYFHFLRREDERTILSKIAELDKNNQEQKKIAKKGAWPYDLRLLSEYCWTIYGSEFKRNDLNQKIYKEPAGSKGHFYFGRAKANNNLYLDGKNRDFHILPSFDYYMREILKLCREQHIEVAIEQFPMNPASFNGINGTKYQKGHQKYLKALAKDFPEVTMVYSNPQYDADCFGDTTHLNEKGAKKYSAYLKERYVK